MSEITAFVCQTGIPVGTIIAFAGEQNRVPKGWLICDGIQVDKTRYPHLFDAIGTVWGGSGTPNFYLPDLRGMFLRGVSSDSKNDPDKNQRISPQLENSPTNPGNKGNDVGSIQNDQVGKAPYDLIRQRGNVTFDNPGQGTVLRAGNPSDSNIDHKQMEIYTGTGNETRPKNAYVYYIIKVDE